jgi:Ca-activated chloride channel family protein
VVQRFHYGTAILAFLALSAPHPAGAQTASYLSGPDSLTFKVGVETVALHVTVTDERQSYVGGLTRDDFVVYDQGVRQDVSIFAAGEVPLDLLLLVDLSGSVRDRLHLVRSAAKQFLTTLKPGDRGAIIGFNQRVRVLADWTSDRQVLARGIDTAQAAGGTALYTAIDVAIRGLEPARLEAGGHRRRVLVILSDGHDTSSLVSYEDVIETCRRSGLVAYAVSFRRDLEAVQDAPDARLRRAESEGDYVLKRLAQETGARAFPASSVRQLPAIFEEIASELAHQYLIGYVPSPDASATGFHAVSVEAPGRTGLTVRTRLGYVRAGPGRDAGRASGGLPPPGGRAGVIN